VSNRADAREAVEVVRGTAEAVTEAVFSGLSVLAEKNNAFFVTLVKQGHQENVSF
jgi:hypothetical protein